MCKYIDMCSFYIKFKNRESFIWKAMIKNYCIDGAECTRFHTYNKQGFKEFPAEIMPTGNRVSKVFLSLR